MSHLVEMSVTGLAGRSDTVEIKFDRSVNVIFGVNGVGKTTLLKIAHAAFMNDSAAVLDFPFETATVKFYSVHADAIITRSIDLKNAPNDQVQYADAAAYNLGTTIRRASRSGMPANFGWKTECTKKTDKANSSFAHEYLPTSRLLSSDIVGRRASVPYEMEGEALINLAMEDQLRRQWVQYYSHLQTEVRTLQEQGMAQILSTVLSPAAVSKKHLPLDAEQAYDLAREFLYKRLEQRFPASKAVFLKNYNEDPKLASVISAIAEVEDDVEKKMQPCSKLQTLLNKMFHNKSVVLVGGEIGIHFGKKNLPLRLSQLSSGEKQALYVLIHALRADISTLIVDEPELSMHIDWQRELVGAILELNPQVQIVFATHSPEIMAQVGDEFIHMI